MSEHVAITPIREICSPAAMADDASHAQGIEEFLDHIYAIDREVRLNERFDPGAAEPCNPGAKQPGAFIFDLDRKSTRRTPVTNAHLVCRLLLEKKNTKNN